MKTKYDAETVKRLFAMKDTGVSHRNIAKSLFGKRSMCSTVSMLLDRFNYYSKETPIETTEVDRMLKILLLDIETAPSISYHWGRWKVNVGTNQVISRPYLITWSAKWLGDSDDKIMSDCIAFYDGFVDNPKDDSKICQSIWNLLDKADIVIAHYGKRFDMPQLNARFVVNGMKPPSPYTVIDTKEQASKFFKFEANSLKELADHLGAEENKLDMTFEDWRNCVEGYGTPEAWDKMVTYNERDITTLEYVYMKIRAYATNHPNVAIRLPEEENNVPRCTVCASDKLKKLDKNAYTMVSMFDSYRCESCGHVSRGRKNRRSKENMKNTLQNVL